MSLVRNRITHEERVDDALVAVEFAVGVARCPQFEAQLFIGITFNGMQDDEGVRGDVVLTLELAEALAGLLSEAVTKAKGGGSA